MKEEQRGTVWMHSTRQAQFATENVRINEIPFARAVRRSSIPRVAHEAAGTGLDHRHRWQSLHSIVVKVHNGCLQGLRGEGRGGQESKRETPPRQRDNRGMQCRNFLEQPRFLRLNIHGHGWELNKQKFCLSYPDVSRSRLREWIGNFPLQLNLERDFRRKNFKIKYG